MGLSPPGGRMTTPESQQEAQSDAFTAGELRDAWMILSPEDRGIGFKLLPRGEAEDFFLELPAHDQSELLLSLPVEEQRSWMRLLPPDDAADLVQETPA